MPTSPAIINAVTVVSAAVVAIGIMLATEQSTARPPDVVGGLLLVLSALPLLARRRWPVGCVMVMVVVSMIYLSADYPGGAELPVFMVAAFGLASTGRRWWAIAVVGAMAGGGAVYRLGVEHQNPVPVLFTTVLLVGTILLGDGVHSRRRLRHEIRERLRAAHAEQEQATQTRLTEERLRIAHELHDVMAHTITTMTVQTGAARDLLPHRPEDASEVLRQVRATARDAMAELRATITVLRGDEDDVPRDPTPGLAQLEELIAGVQRAGLHVDLQMRGDDRHIPPAVQLTAYRVIQEALTNVIRHAQTDRARVEVCREPSTLRIRIDDDGRGPDGASADGHGLRGLHERVHAVGGQLSLGPGPDSGFRVDAILPTAGVPA